MSKSEDKRKEALEKLSEEKAVASTSKGAAAASASAAAEEADAVERKGKVEGVSVYDRAGNFVRTYTSVHDDPKGLDHVKKAEGYAEKIGGTVRKAK